MNVCCIRFNKIKRNAVYYVSVNGKTATSLELPLDTDQATKFLDEHDLHDVLNKMPDEAFDLLTGMFTFHC